MNSISYILFLASVTLSLEICPAIAGNIDELNFIGFSSDGKYLAYEIYGNADGSGGPYSEIRIIDTQRNNFATQPYEFKGYSEEGELRLMRARVLEKAKARLKQLKIQLGNSGNHVVSHLQTDLSVSPYNARFNFGEGGDQEFELQLSAKKIFTNASNEETHFCQADPGVKIFTLVLIENKTKKKQVLQRDSILPKSRGCVIDYRIQDVYVYSQETDKPVIAVFLNIFTPNAEGNNHEYLVVAGESSIAHDDLR